MIKIYCCCTLLHGQCSGVFVPQHSIKESLVWGSLSKMLPMVRCTNHHSRRPSRHGHFNATICCYNTSGNVKIDSFRIWTSCSSTTGWLLSYVLCHNAFLTIFLTACTTFLLNPDFLHVFLFVVQGHLLVMRTLLASTLALILSLCLVLKLSLFNDVDIGKTPLLLQSYPKSSNSAAFNLVHRQINWHNVCMVATDIVKTVFLPLYLSFFWTKTTCAIWQWRFMFLDSLSSR